MYTIPADYEKIRRLAEGLLGTSDLSSVSPDKARNAGANVNAFVAGATGKNIYDSYSPTYFQAYGRNYREFVKNATGVDPGATTSSTSFTNAGRNYRNLAQGMTGLGITDYRYYYYNYAGRNVKNLAEGQTGLSIRDSRYYYFKNAGVNINTTVRKLGVTGWTSGYAWSVATTPTGTVDENITQFKKRADQSYYDLYLNPNGLKKAFTNLDGRVTSATAGVTPISTYNKAELNGGVASGGLVADYNLNPIAKGYYTKTMSGKDLCPLVDNDNYEGGCFNWFLKYKVLFAPDGKVVAWRGWGTGISREYTWKRFPVYDKDNYERGFSLLTGYSYIGIFKR